MRRKNNPLLKKYQEDFISIDNSLLKSSIRDTKSKEGIRALVFARVPSWFYYVKLRLRKKYAKLGFA